VRCYGTVMRFDVGVLVGTLALAVLAPDAAHARFGGPLPDLGEGDLASFEEGRNAFRTTEDADEGLGPVFNDSSCGACHRVPAVGGASRVVETRFGRARLSGFDPLDALGGSLIQVKGIGTVDTCDYAGEVVPAIANVTAGRRTTPLFGLGLVDAVPDATLVQLAASERQRSPQTAGRVHMVADAPTASTRVGRFGWKAQVATLHHFSGEAYLMEMGITSEFFPEEQCPQGDCAALACDPADDPEDEDGDVEKFLAFMRLLAPPPSRPIEGRAADGATVFARIGCDDCHRPELQTGTSDVAALDHVTFQPYSDFLLHDMGSLGDGIAQGDAREGEMRTAPLWGIRRQHRLLHDGRATSIADAILQHDGQGAAASAAFAALEPSDQRLLLRFLRRL